MGIFLSIIALVITCSVLIGMTYRAILSRKKLNEPSDVLRVLSNTEKKYLKPSLLVNNLALVSDNIYRLESAEVVINTVTAQGNSTSKMYADGIEIYFPELLELYISSFNDIEYVITNIGIKKIATAISVNGYSLLEVSEAMWKGNEKAQLISSRVESKTEYRYRLSTIKYGFSALCFFVALTCLWMSLLFDNKYVFGFFCVLGVTFAVAMVWAYYRVRRKVKKIGCVQKVKGSFFNIIGRGIVDANKLAYLTMIGLHYPVKTVHKKIGFPQKTENDDDIIIADIIEKDISKGSRYELLGSSRTSSIDELYNKKNPRPWSRLAIFLGVAAWGVLTLGVFNPLVDGFDTQSLDRAFFHFKYSILKPEVNHTSVQSLIDGNVKTKDVIKIENVDTLYGVTKGNKDNTSSRFRNTYYHNEVYEFDNDSVFIGAKKGLNMDTPHDLRKGVVISQKDIGYHISHAVDKQYYGLYASERMLHAKYDFFMAVYEVKQDGDSRIISTITINPVIGRQFLALCVALAIMIVTMLWVLLMVIIPAFYPKREGAVEKRGVIE